MRGRRPGKEEDLEPLLLPRVDERRLLAFEVDRPGNAGDEARNEVVNVLRVVAVRGVVRVERGDERLRSRDRSADGRIECRPGLAVHGGQQKKKRDGESGGEHTSE